jgi:hypothetical protein
VQREINEKRQELLAKEESLRFVFKVKAMGHVTKEVATGTWRVDLRLKARKGSSATRIVASVDYRDVVYPESLIVSACTLVENFLV